MYKLDFLSNSPKNFIFQKATNKTNLGGILTLIYIIIIILITIFYFINFNMNERFNIDFISEYNERYESDDKMKEKILPKKSIPFFDFRFSLSIDKDIAKNIISDSKIIAVEDHFLGTEKITKDIVYESSDIFGTDYLAITNNHTNLSNQIYLYYKCDNPECSNNFDYSVHLNVYYNRFYYEHQNPDCPVLQTKNPKAKIDMKDRYIYFHNSKIIKLNWQVIKYKEKKGILNSLKRFFSKKEDDQYIYSLILRKVEEIDGINYNQEIDGEKYKLFFTIINDIDYRYYEEYTRKKMKFWM